MTEPNVMIFLKVLVTWTGVLGLVQLSAAHHGARKAAKWLSSEFIAVLSSICFISFHVSVLVLAYTLVT